MGAEVSGIIEFLYTVFTNWILLAGGVVMTLIGIGEWLWRKEVHWKTYLGVLACLLLVVFYMSWRDIKIKLEAAPTSPTIKLDVTDVDGRKKIESLTKQLEAADKKIRSQEFEFNPLNQPISSVKFTVVLNLPDKSENPTRDIGSGPLRYSRSRRSRHHTRLDHGAFFKPGEIYICSGCRIRLP
jgi:hypothetical protein